MDKDYNINHKINTTIVCLVIPIKNVSDKYLINASYAL